MDIKFELETVEYKGHATVEGNPEKPSPVIFRSTEKPGYIVIQTTEGSRTVKIRELVAAIDMFASLLERHSSGRMR
jgi:hypothetical protein